MYNCSLGQMIALNGSLRLRKSYLKHILPTLIVRDKEFQSGIFAPRTESKPYIEFVTRAQGWRDSLIDTCPLVHKRDFSVVFRAPVVDMKLKLFTSHGLIMHGQMAPWLSSYDLLNKRLELTKLYNDK